MIKYKGCKIYKVEDKNTVLAVVDIETASALNIYSSFEFDRYREDKQMTAYVRETEYSLERTGYQIFVQGVGDFKITSFLKKQINAGDFKAKYRYQMTLEG